MREHVVGDHERSGLELRAGRLEEPLVVVLLRVEEDHVEDVVDVTEGLGGVSFDQLGPFVEPRLGDVRAPGVDLAPGPARARAPGRRDTRTPAASQRVE